MADEQPKVSPYQLLNKWLFDGSDTSPIPEDLVNTKAISPHYILYYFRFSYYIVLISKLFNNYYIYSMNRCEMFRCLKQCVSRTRYKPPFIPKNDNDDSTKFSEAIRVKYPLLNNQDVNLLESILSETDEYDSICESLGLSKPKKKKLTAADKKQQLKSADTQVLNTQSNNPNNGSSLQKPEQIKEVTHFDTLFT